MILLMAPGSLECTGQGLTSTTAKLSAAEPTVTQGFPCSLGSCSNVLRVSLDSLIVPLYLRVGGSGSLSPTVVRS